ncbi:hypothetical protein [Pelagibacterium halotolerans]|uniref:Uncharacterized protein n=1 Tax=Pelagibacterium halotolerans (strain DSM 22347 / JCM 15775 / CGMCC 1.7692 / B2) TaxID=1082931 RepID=G4R9I4_PELHB|nr:hypothetical protein [Pelagibacterium halotolerans]AEQ50404.1 hypothetical protein KKY_360 [Pelagibacterium halotolerans B2]QJR16986.1 hypothetical protein HKM20_14980 [Pelagibacterium halotolerans]SDZ86396.1 hypothetical protein SAMN05428936_101295 [Pelagibacterium halotolerans]
MKEKTRDRAPAFRERKVPGPKKAGQQVRDAGADATRDDKSDWDAVDEAVDETFPASDATAKY